MNPTRDTEVERQRMGISQRSHLGTDVIDLYQIHRPDLFTHPAELADALAGLRDEGKIREVGVSNFTPDSMRPSPPICRSRWPLLSPNTPRQSWGPCGTARWICA